MNKGIVLIILGAIIIATLFAVDEVASKQVFGPPYSYEYNPDSRLYEKYSTFYPERAQGWVREYYHIDTILWGVGLSLSATLIGLGFGRKGKTKVKER